MIRIFTILTSVVLVAIIAIFWGWHHIAGKLKQNVLFNEVEGKICALQARYGSSEIVIAGDSRALNQLIPVVFEKETGLSAVNIAGNGCDLITFANAVHAHPELIAKAKLILISVGIQQINDGLPVSMASFLNFGILDQIRIYWNLLGKLSEMYREAFRIYRNREWWNMRFECGDYWNAGYELYSTKGFFPNTGVWNQGVLKNSWYTDLRLHGSRRRQFEETMGKIHKLGIPVVVFQSQYAPSWLRDSVSAGAVKSEQEFGRTLKNLIAQYDNIHFMDFFSPRELEFPDSLFYDPGHLNVTGAEVFSQAIIKELKVKHLLPDAISISRVVAGH